MKLLPKALKAISTVICCASLSITTSMAAHAAATRPDVHLMIYNNTNKTMYPVVRDVVGGQEKRIYVNGGAGMAAQSQAQLIITGDMGDAGQIIVFSQPPTLLAGEPTVNALSSGGAKDKYGNIIVVLPTPDAFREDHPSQLLEYTIDGGMDAGWIDFDYSGVNHLSIPVALEAVDNNNRAVMGYAGTTASLPSIQTKLQQLVNGDITRNYFSKTRKVGWPYYQQTAEALIKVPTAYNIFALKKSSSYLANPPKNNTMLVTNINNAANVGTPWVADVLTQRWLGWTRMTGNQFLTPSDDNVEQVVKPGEFAVACQDDFCHRFASSVQRVFQAAATNLKKRGVITDVNDFLSAKVVVEALLGFTFSSDPNLPNYLTDNIRDTYKAIMRGVPSPNDETSPQYSDRLHPDPAGSYAQYNLNIIDWFVHKKLGFFGYGFSIDDDRGNIRSPGTQLVMTIGGPKGLPYDHPFDPVHQQTVIFGAGWSNISSGSDKYADKTGALSFCQLGPNHAGSCFVAVDATNQNRGFNHVVAWLGNDASSPSVSVDLIANQNSLSFANCQVRNNVVGGINPNVCKAVQNDPHNPFVLIIPNPGAGGGNTDNAQATIYFPTGWESFSSADCPINQAINGSSVPSSKIGGVAGAVDFHLSTQRTCSFTARDTAGNAFSYAANFVPSSGYLSCVQGCKASATPVPFQSTNQIIQVSMPEPIFEGPDNNPGGNSTILTVYLAPGWTGLGTGTTCPRIQFNTSAFPVSVPGAGCRLELIGTSSGNTAVIAAYNLTVTGVTCVVSTANGSSALCRQPVGFGNGNVNIPTPDSELP